jgi:hypothetical protein
MVMAVPKPTHVAGCQCAHCANKNGTVAAIGKLHNCTSTAPHVHAAGCKCAHCMSQPKPTSMLHGPGCKCAVCCGNGTMSSTVKPASSFY